MKVLITGSRGTIGTILVAGLRHDITAFDLPDHDARSLEQLTSLAAGHDAIVHLAWDTRIENYQSDDINPDNALMAFNVYRAALEAGVGRVVMASSVHADDASLPREGLLSPTSVPTPDSPYGATKVFVEALGRYYAGQGLAIVCLRFGGVRLNHATRADFGARERVPPSWLSHHDCIALVEACLTAEVPGGYAVIYAVSDNEGRVHDTGNALGWFPQPR